MSTKWTLRSHASGDAGGAGRRLATSSRERMNRSMGSVAQAVSRTSGIVGGVTDLKHQRSERNRNWVSQSAVRLTTVWCCPVRGSAAPSRTHRTRSATTLSGSLGRSFGMALSARSCLTAWISGLASGFPGTMAGPESPPFRSASRESTRSPPLAVPSAPWQSRHRSTSTGRMRLSKNSRCRARGSSAETAGPVLAASISAAPHQWRRWIADRVRLVPGSGGCRGRRLVGEWATSFRGGHETIRGL